MIVHPEYFRKGIGQQLLTEIEVRNRNITSFHVSTGKENLPAKSLYLKNGYRFKEDIEIVPGLFISNFEKDSAK